MEEGCPIDTTLRINWHPLSQASLETHFHIMCKESLWAQVGGG